MEVYRYVEVILRRWWLIPLFLLVGVASAWFYSRGQTPLYQSTVTIALNPAVPADLIPYVSAGSGGSGPAVERLAGSYGEFLKSRNFAALVVARLGVADSPEALARAISTKLTPGTNVFRITVTWNHPTEAQRIANGVAEVFISENLRLQQAKTDLPARQAELEQSLLYYRPKIEALRAERDALESSSSLTTLQKDDALEKLDTRLASLETIYSNLQAQLRTLQTAGQTGLNTASIIDEAPYPAEPVSPRPAQSLLFAAVSSLALAVGLAFLLEYLDFTVKRPEDVEAILGTAPLGVVGMIPGGSPQQGAGGLSPKLITAAHIKAPVSEAFRALRTNLQFCAVERPFRTLLITSTIPGEGKTLVAANLAVAFAQAGQRVLLVDTDLRRPALHRLFGLPNERGFTTLTVDNVERLEVEDDLGGGYAQLTAVPNLWVLTSGPLPPNPVELISSRRAEEVFQQVGRLFDLVVYDSPPAGGLSDAVVLARQADATLVVVQAGKARRDVLGKVVGMLAKSGARVAGTVVNMVKPSSLGYYSYYYHHYYHYYGSSAERRNGDGHGDDRPTAGRRGLLRSLRRGLRSGNR